MPLLRAILASGVLLTALAYPIAYRGTESSVFFGITVPDPYRWMEKVDAPDTRAWSAAEDTLTRSYLSRLPLRNALHERLSNLWNYHYAAAPKIYGSLHVRLGVVDKAKRLALVARYGISGRERTVLDSGDPQIQGTISLDSASFSKSGRYLAFSTALKGSKATVWHVRDVRTLSLLDDQIRSDPSSKAVWTADGRGFFYETVASTDHNRMLIRIVYHRLHDRANGDRVAFSLPMPQKSTIDTAVTRDGRWLVLTASAYGEQLTPRFFIGEAEVPGAPVREIFARDRATRGLVDSLDGSLLFERRDATCPNVCVDRVDPRTSRIRVLIPDSGRSLTADALVGDKIFSLYSIDAHSTIVEYDATGRRLRTLALPAIGTIDSDDFRDDGTGRYLLAHFSSYTIPPTLFAFDAATGERTLIGTATVNYDPNAFVTEQRFFSSADGTHVPMFVTHLRSLALDGANPTILYVYGGFDVSEEPVWTPEIVTWLSIGGVYAVVNARGGDEYGEAWHLAGTRMNKQHTIDDVIAAAEELGRDGYARSDRLALRGDSNGGFVAANAALQRPEVFRAIITREGLLDLLRYDVMMDGEYYKEEYGSKNESAAIFENMLHLSPVSQVKSNVSYPAALIQTGDADDIVSPAHSFKFVAALQADPSQTNPVLLRVDHGVGHGGGESLDLVIDESVDQYSFLLNLMGVSQLHENS